MEFPALVYRCPGPHFGPSGTTYESRGVEDELQLLEAISQGWLESLVLAVSDHQNEEQSEDDLPPTRYELEQKANELGIKFDGRTTDRKLLEKIEEVLRGE
jgi:hypothetical protein